MKYEDNPVVVLLITYWNDREPAERDEGLAPVRSILGRVGKTLGGLASTGTGTMKRSKKLWGWARKKPRGYTRKKKKNEKKNKLFQSSYDLYILECAIQLLT